jgi:hypothetical protein
MLEVKQQSISTQAAMQMVAAAEHTGIVVNVPTQVTSWHFVRKRGWPVFRGQRNGSPRSLISVF